MPLFKTGDATHDQFAGYTTEQLIEIVTDTSGSYLAGEVETARKVLLARGYDYQSREQKRAEQEVQAINASRNNTASRQFPTPRVRITRSNQPPTGGSRLKTWHWIWIILIFIRVIGCLMQHR